MNDNIVPMTQESTPPMSPEQVRDYVKSHYALGLPSGSIRALLAVITFGGIWGWMAFHPEQDVPPYLRDLMFIIMGHYFAARRQHAPEIGPPPLYLPRGAVRTLLLAGFVIVAGVLFYQNRMIAHEAGSVRLNNAGITLILVCGFLLGVTVSRLGGKSSPRYVEDLRAIVSLAAGVVLLLLVFKVISVSEEGWLHQIHGWKVHYQEAQILAAVVGFYFGSRS